MDAIEQTLRFVQSLPKRERIPFAQKFRNADPLGKFVKTRFRQFGQGVSEDESVCVGILLNRPFALIDPPIAILSSGFAGEDARV